MKDSCYYSNLYLLWIQGQAQNKVKFMNCKDCYHHGNVEPNTWQLLGTKSTTSKLIEAQFYPYERPAFRAEIRTCLVCQPLSVWFSKVYSGPKEFIFPVWLIFFSILVPHGHLYTYPAAKLIGSAGNWCVERHPPRRCSEAAFLLWSYYNLSSLWLFLF